MHTNIVLGHRSIVGGNIDSALLYCIVLLYYIVLCVIVCVLDFTFWDYCVLQFVYVLDLLSSVLCQEIGWEERLWNDLFCVKLDVKP